MLHRLSLTVVMLAMLAGGAHAQGYDGSPDDRFTIVETASGIVRIDRETGEVSSCREMTGGWTCVIAADEREAYEAELDRLSLQNKELADRIAELEKRLAAKTPGASKTAPSGSDILRLFENPPPLSKKDEKELERFLGVTEKAVRGFFGVMRELEKEFKDDTEE